MKKIDISKFIQENNNTYSDTLDTQIQKVEELVNNKVISPTFGGVIISYLIKKDISNVVRASLDQMVHNHGKKDQWLVLNYSRKRTNYI